MAYNLPPALSDFLVIAEISNGQIANKLFHKKFSQVTPEYGQHIALMAKLDEGVYGLASYLHIWFDGSIGLIGGGCSDGDIIQRLPEPQRRLINEHGGLLRQTLLFTFDRFAEQTQAFFGHCGDTRAKEVDLAAGFEETEDPNVLVKWSNLGLDSSDKYALFEQALALGAF
ncbi:MAG: hypothetical protein OIF38_01535 [Cellvibrionaceae bacterium]|nr:hypothetical protein [Cellvibrionaceae bacterium]